MPAVALLLVLVAATMHACWNLAAKQAADSRHFVWLFSVVALVLYGPVVGWIVWTERPAFGPSHWLALAGTSALHIVYPLLLQAGYRASDLSLVYPLARGSGPLLSFFLAVLILGEPFTWQAALGVLLVVAGILLVSGMLDARHAAPRAGILYGLGTGACIAAYTVNDGWAVKVLLISPVILDWAANLVRALVLAPRAWHDRAGVRAEVRRHGPRIAIVGVLAPLGYILVLYAMQLAPVSHVAPARELATLLGTFLGARLLGERAAPARLAGAACIVAGVVSLALADPG